ncbi:Regulatory protein AsnC [Roseovarius albus]|uniref:Regulatory protein AsnC n=1 Tax=Roseovarius albus TaxID=1247867 RepID=A0A1X6ZHH0_9RHOB|nr:Lrp/AsnC family transcriptional regulator [Roseovarius albus]SLN51350.1 Regulatory protein AsnC [Roseovarius albus]
MDEIDRQLIFLLGEDARRSATDLATELGVSRVTVQNRIDRLIESGAIRRFTVELGQGGHSTAIEALVLLKLSNGDSRKTIARLKEMTEVHSFTSANGMYDFILELRVSTLPRLDQVLADIRRLPLVLESNSCIRMKRFK